MLNRAMPYLGRKLVTEIKEADIIALLDEVVAKRQNERKDMTTGPNAEARTIQICLDRL